MPLDSESPGNTPEYVAEVLKKGSNFYTIGTRGYYFAFPLLMWLFGPIPMFLCSLVLVPTLHFLDQAGDLSKSLVKEKVEEDVEEGSPSGNFKGKDEKVIPTNVYHVFAD